MGFSISWLSASGQDLPERLDLKRTGKKGAFFDFGIAGKPLKNGSYLLVLGRCDHKFISDDNMARLSANGDALACSIEEHVMFSKASFWKDGQNLWSIAHNGDTDPPHADLTVTGTPPDPFASIRDDCAKRSLTDKDVDWYFEIPLLVAKGLTGFKHDDKRKEDDDTFEELVAASVKPWWKFWN
jgi:hypothetical protein